MTARRNYGTLDGLRGVAAIAVVVVHAPMLMGSIQAPSAGLAVDLFFVMSGFIIAHAYEGKLRDGMTAGHFIALRLARLYPLYLLGLVLGVGQALSSLWLGSSGTWTPETLLMSAGAGLFMLPTLTGGPAFGLNPPGWSLFFELVINIAYVLALPRLSTRLLGVIVALSGLALVVLGLQHGDLHFGSHADNFAGGFARVAFSFPAGVLIYRLAPNGCRVKLPSLLLMALAAAIFAVPAGAYTAAFEIAMVLIALPALVILAVSVEPAKGLASPFKFLGVVSYGVYSLHYPLVLLTGSIAKRVPVDLTPWIGLAFLGGLIFACWLIDRYYDAPLRRWLTSALPAAPRLRPSPYRPD